jgi:hypothetical protein
MSRHNRRRRRARHSRHNESAYWDSTGSSGSGSISSIGSMPSGYGQRPVNYSPLFWNANTSANPWSRRLPADNGMEYLYRRGLPIPHGLTSRDYGTMLSRADKRMARWHAHDTITHQDQDCDSMCEGMANVVEFLFDGSTDYDDEEIERKAELEKRSSRSVVASHPLSTINYSSFGVII